MLPVSTPLDQFLAAAAAKLPVPGGGAIAAVTGAAACSMAEMVVAYTLGRKGAEAAQETLKLAAHRLGQSRTILLRLAEEDQLAYERLVASWKLPADDPERAIAADVARAVPEETAAMVLAVLETATMVAPVGNVNLLSDLAVALDLGAAAVKSAVHNIRVNTPAATPDDRCQRWVKSAERLAAEGNAVVWSRIATKGS